MGRRMRRTAALLLAVAACSLLAACGKSDRTSTTVSIAEAPAPAQGTGGRQAAPGAARPWTKAQAEAFAHAVNLTAADLPGFAVAPASVPGETPAERRLQAETARCLGGTGGTGGTGGRALAEVSSPHFQRIAGLSSASVSSEVNVASTPALAGAELAKIRSPRTRVCLTRYMQGVLGSRTGGSVQSAVRVVEGNPPAPGTAGGFGWRITVALAVHGAGIPVYLDILGFIDGPAEVSLFSTGLPQPLPAAAEEHLYALLLKRAIAQKP